MGSLFDDVRYSIRSLSRKPLVAAVVILTLALGIGVNAAMYSVIHAAVLTPLPFPEPQNLARIYSAFEGRRCCPLSGPNYLDIRERQTSFEDVVAYGSVAVAITGDGDPVRVSGYEVTDGLFEMLGAAPQVGRFITADDDRFGAEPVVVISDALWRERFAADEAIMGESLVIDSVPHAIIGVAPPEFRVTGTPQVFMPFAWDPDDMPGRDSNRYMAIGRLPEGTTLEAAMGEIESIYADLVAEYPNDITNQGVSSLSLDEWLIGSSRRRPLLVLWGAVAMVLLVACVNVANLMLARAEARQRELAVRAAIGAPRGRLVRHFLSESILVAVIGAAVGLAFAWLGLRLLLVTYGGAIPRSREISLNPAVLVFVLGMTLATGLIVGLVPALQTRPSRLHDALRDGGRGSSGRQTLLRQGLVVVEIAIALVLVVGAGLMLKSFWRLSRVDVGVAADQYVTARISLPEARYPEPAAVLTFWDSFLEELDRLPNIESASVASAVPFTGTYNNYSRIMPSTDLDRVATFVESRAVSPAFFETMRLPLLQGRNFANADTLESQQVVIINRELARQIFPDDDAVGRSIVSGPGGTPRQVVGIVENLLEHGPERPPAPTVYFSYQQSPRGSMAFTIRAVGEPLDVIPEIRRIAGELDAEIPIYSIFTFDQLLFNGTGSRRFTMSLLSIFAGLALTLGAVGIYGVMAYTVERRTREIGLRQALGAAPGTVLREVIGQGFRLAVVGIAIGGAGAFMLRQGLASMLFEVNSLDPVVYASVSGILILVATLACAIPARRAAAVDPMVALRND